MKNLKRALSLVLSAAMMVGLLAVGASAASMEDFSDTDEITHTEAVSTLVELGVVAGKDSGAFDPTGIVTRAEMAKMICVVLNGGKDPQLSATGTVSYKDTASHWAAAYIEYCTNLSIVAGDGTGNFNPNATVTGTQAAKMLLVAMGYKSDIEGFTGATWATAVDVRANQKGLYDEMDITTSAGLTRDDAAQMVYNALNAVIVTYDYTLVTNNGQLGSLPTLKDDEDDKTMLEDKFNAVKVEGVVVGNEYAKLAGTTKSDELFGSNADDGETLVRVTNYKDGQDNYGNTDKDKVETFKISSDADVLGRAVTFYVKPSTTSATSAKKGTVLGSLMLDSDNKVVYDYSSDKPNDVLDDNDLDWSSEFDAPVYYNYAVKTGDEDVSDNSFKTTSGTKGQERIFIDSDGDGDVDMVLVNNYGLAKVLKYSTKDDGSITVDATGYGSLALTDEDDVVGFDDVAKNDYVVAMIAGGKLHVAVAKTVTGSLDAYKNNSSDKATSLTVDGTKYDVSAEVCSSKLDAAVDQGVSTKLDNDSTYYLDAQGYIVAVGDSEETAGNYAFVKGADKGSGVESARVKLVLQDGTTKTYDVNDDSTLTVQTISDEDVVADSASTPNVYTLVSYSLNSKDEVKLSPAANTVTGTVSSFTKKKTSIAYTDPAEVVDDDGNTSSTGSNPTYYASSSTVFFYVKYDGSSIDSVDVYTGYNQAPSTNVSGDASVALSSSDKVEAVAFSDVSASTDNDDHLFLYKWGNTYSDYREAYVYMPGSDDNEMIKVDGGSDYSADNLYLFTKNSDDTYDLSSTSGAAVSGVVQNDPKTTVVLDNGEEYKVIDSTVTIDNTDTDDDPPIAALNDAGCDTGDTVSIIANNDNEILMLVVTANP
ncbi:MAG: S-layer homology domain-containing protein [Intestinimonas sp.]|jgi:hypothetical protein|nr:S-layer homology domain-containing protein [Intestinimonas sp.]